LHSLLPSLANLISLSVFLDETLLQKELCEYQQEHGNCHVPTKYRQNTALGRWVSTQRSDYKKFQEGKKSTMTEDKIARLESIGFAWFMAL